LKYSLFVTVNWYHNPLGLDQVDRWSQRKVGTIIDKIIQNRGACYSVSLV